MLTKLKEREKWWNPNKSRLDMLSPTSSLYGPTDKDY